jgi:hypothetical protein
MAPREDWAAEGQRRVANGSDGLWLRCGTPADGSCKANFFSFRFNPCVSFFSLVLLSSLSLSALSSLGISVRSKEILGCGQILTALRT